MHILYLSPYLMSLSIIMRSYGNSFTCTLCFLSRYSFKHFWLKWTFFTIYKERCGAIWFGSLPCSIGKVFGHNCHSASLGTKDQGTKDQKDNSNGISGLQFGSSMRIRFAWRSTITSVSCCFRIRLAPSLGFSPLFLG